MADISRVTVVTLKEWRDNGHPMPWYLRLLAPLHHMWKVHVRGFKPFDVNSMDAAHSTPGYGAPRCPVCDGFVGKCDHHG